MAGAERAGRAVIRHEPMLWPRVKLVAPEPKCRLCGATDTVLMNVSTGYLYCVDFAGCDKRRQAFNSRRAA